MPTPIKQTQVSLPKSLANSWIMHTQGIMQPTNLKAKKEEIKFLNCCPGVADWVWLDNFLLKNMKVEKIGQNPVSTTITHIVHHTVQIFLIHKN